MGGGVVFLIVVPTSNFERELIYGKQLNTNQEVILPTIPTVTTAAGNATRLPSNADTSGNNLNINLPDTNAVLRLEVELRDKNAPKNRRGGRGGGRGGGGGGGGRGGGGGGGAGQNRGKLNSNDDKDNLMVPLEKVLEELLTKLEIEHVTWSTGKKGYYYHVVFPLPSGEPCETTLHCLTELGIGTKLNSSVSVLPCSVSYDAISNPPYNNEEYSIEDNEDFSKWNNFVDSIKSKLTVKQVVDGVRAGGCLTFDYLLLIVTADSLAALGLIENNASNIVAAMLVSPLMGPVMSITFGTIISDRELIKVGFVSLSLGMFISCVFGFIFGLIVGTTEQPWGSGDWPTEEMRGRGNVRSLWMALPWALTSGTGVAVALLQGSTGPLIGVAISASLLPPVVNCGLFWALACIWLMYPGVKLPHLQGEPYTGNSSYPFLYTDYLPTEFLINGIVSGLLTVINVCCIFITAIIILKIKEVSAPYTASPDLKRFWETDLRTVRKTNRSTIRNRKNTFRDKLLHHEAIQEPRSKKLDTVLEQAIKEATDDVTFNKVKRMSYSNNAAGGLTQRLAQAAGLNSNQSNIINATTADTMDSVRNSKLNVDLPALDKLVSSLLEHHQQQQSQPGSGGGGGGGGTLSTGASMKLNRRRPMSRSANHFMYSPSTMASNEFGGGNNLSLAAINNNAVGGGGGGGGTGAGNTTSNSNRNSSAIQHTALMPTILEQNRNPVGTSWSLDRSTATAGVRNVLNSIANAPHRLSQSLSSNHDEDNVSLTRNILD